MDELTQESLLCAVTAMEGLLTMTKLNEKAIKELELRVRELEKKYEDK